MSSLQPVISVSSILSKELVMNSLHLQQRIWSPYCSEQAEENYERETEESSKICTGRHDYQTFGFNVKEAVLFPPEAGKGMWPENYSLSDHAPLTVTFSPVRVPCGQTVY